MSTSAKKPRFSDARGLNMAMQSVPPFEFEGVTMRVFPLRAKTEIVQRFVDAYLNIVPPEVGYFRAYLPYVFLDLINYGRMSAVAANLGWLAQREIAFSVPLEWYVREGDHYVFRDWAYLSPFIYVDSNISMTTGREVYGWPKALIHIEQDESDWMRDPRNPGKLVTVSANVFPEVYAGKQEQARAFLEVERIMAPSPLAVPLDYGRILGPWLDLPSMLGNASALMRDWYELLAGVGILRSHVGVGPDNYRRMTSMMIQGMRPYDGTTYFNTVNLKQFRSADEPSSICYQALTNARMDITRFNAGGLLGDPASIPGDPSGGLRVLIHRYASEPVVEMLGLEVEDEWPGSDTTVASIAPVFPCWMDVDMRYNLPHTEAWRTKVTTWTDAENRRFPAHDVLQEGDPPPYNTARGAASQQIGGPFDFPKTTLRVLPLLAERQPLVDFCRDYLNGPLASTGMRFEPWGTYVYLVVGSNEGALSESNNIGWWAGRDVTFYLPVKWYETIDGKETLRTLAVVPVFSYANSTTAAITGSEVSGIPTVNVSIESPASTWLDEAGPSDVSERRFLRMIGELLPVLGEGQRAEQREILEIRDGLMLPPNDDTAWRFVAERWGQRLKDDLARMRRTAADHPAEMDDARALALEVLANGQPINVLTMKQFRDGDDPYAACYQSLVQIRRRLLQITDLREIESRVFVRIHEYPSQPIVQTLGLVAKHVSGDGATKVAEIEPVRPFWIKAAMREELATTVRRRAGSEAWESDPDTTALEAQDPPYFSAIQSNDGPAVGPALAHLVDAWVPQRLAPQAAEWRSRGEDPRLDLASARRAIETIDPQMVIQSILSREWENWGNPRWWQVKDDLAKELAAMEQTSLMTDAVEAQLERLQDAYDQAKRESRRPDVLADIERRGLFEKLHDTGRLLQSLDRSRLLAEQIHQLAPGVHGASDGESGPCARVIQAADRQAMVQLFASNPMFDVLLEALRTADVPLRDAPARRDDFCAYVADELRKCPAETRAALGKKADELAAAWFAQARDEAGRNFQQWLRHETVFELFREALRAAGVTVPATADAAGFLQDLWGDLQHRTERLTVIADAAAHIAKERYAWVRAAVLHALSKAAQKPDFCFDTDTIQSGERALFFPKDECWRDERGTCWYVGPQPGAARPTKVDGISLPLVNAAQK